MCSEKSSSSQTVRPAVMELAALHANKKSNIEARFNFPIPELLP
jgi:hypothetical protein